MPLFKYALFKFHSNFLTLGHTTMTSFYLACPFKRKKKGPSNPGRLLSKYSARVLCNAL